MRQPRKINKLRIIEDRLKRLPVSFTLNEALKYIDIAGIKSRQVVCDPFAGAGILGIACELLGIKSINIEKDSANFSILKKNFSSIRQLLPNKSIRAQNFNADSEKVILNSQIDAIITSPPFTLYKTYGNIMSLKDYQQYINKLALIFKKLKPFLKSDAKILIKFGNDIYKSQKVPLKKKLIEVLSQVGFTLTNKNSIKEVPSDKKKFCISLLLFSNKNVNNNTIVDLTQEIKDRQKVWPGFPPVRLFLWQKKKNNKGWNGSKVSFPIHELTHIDYPFHGFSTAAKGLLYDLKIYRGKGRRVMNQDKIPDVRFLLFPKDIPITNEIITKIIKLKRVRFVGTEYDTLIPEGWGNKTKGHLDLLRRNILIIENLKNVKKLPDREVEIIALPLKVDCDGSPVRIVAFT